MFGIVSGISLGLCVVALTISIGLTVFPKAPSPQMINCAAFLSLVAVLCFLIGFAIIVITSMSVPT